MAEKIEPACLPSIKKATPKAPVIGVFATSDPRIDKDSRIRCQNIVKMAAEVISGKVVMPDKTPVAGGIFDCAGRWRGAGRYCRAAVPQGGRGYSGVRAGYVGISAAYGHLAFAAISGRIRRSILPAATAGQSPAWCMLMPFAARSAQYGRMMQP